MTQCCLTAIVSIFRNFRAALNIHAGDADDCNE
jgi:hypothetical protein